MQFLNPILLWGLPLIAVPIVIHLLNRRRFQRVRWAAMEFLLSAMKRNRRRLQMQHWLILLLRTLAVLLLVFLVARPQLSGPMLGGVRTHHVVCLDDSASMAQREGAGSAWRSAIDWLHAHASGLAQSRGGDLFTLLLSSRPTQPLLAAVPVTAQLPGRLRDVLPGQPGDWVLDPGPLLEAARLRVAEAEAASGTSRARITLLTDFRRHDFVGDDGQAQSDVVAQILALDALAQHLDVRIVGPRDQDNLAVVDVRRQDRFAVQGVPVTFTVDVQNRGLTQTDACELGVEVDGQSRIVREVPPLAAGERRSIPFVHTFRTAGWHGVTARLPADRFPVDDERALALEVRDSSRVLVVDGEPADGGDEGESFFLAVALEPGGDVTSGVNVTVIPDHALAEQDLAGFDMVWLCNVPVPAEPVVSKLEQFAAQGGGVVFFVGSQVDPGRYSDVFWKQGRGLLPAALTEVLGDLDKPQSLFVAEPTHPTMAAVDVLPTLLARTVQIGRWIGIADDPNAPVTTLLRVAGPEGSPLLVARRYSPGSAKAAAKDAAKDAAPAVERTPAEAAAGGEVLLVGTTADARWTDWPTTYSFLITCNAIHRFAVKVRDDAEANLSPRGALRVGLDPSRYRPDAITRSLREGAAERTFSAVADASGTFQLDVPMSELEGFGLFALQLSPHAGVHEQRLLARNPPVDEGRLQKMAPDEFFAGCPPEVAARTTILGGDGSDSDAGLGGAGEVWRPLALLLLGILILETFLASRFGRR